jgi:hypothetical protein
VFASPISFTNPASSRSAMFRPCARNGNRPILSVRPSAFASRSVSPTLAISGLVNVAAGTARQLVCAGCPAMISAAALPCADAKCASCLMSVTSPIAYTDLTEVWSRSLTTILPRSATATPACSRPMSFDHGRRPVATSTQSTSTVLPPARVSVIEPSALSLRPSTLVPR